MLHYVPWNPHLVFAVMLFLLLPASESFGQSPLPPVTADVVISYGSDPGGTVRPSFHYARDEWGRERWDNTYGFVTVHDPVRQETRMWDDISQLFRIFSWNLLPSYGPQVQSQSQLIATQTAPPGHSPQAGAASAACPTDPGGWSLAPPPQPQAPYTATSPQQLNIWTCSLYGLPMYMELIDPVLGEIDVQFQNIQSASFYQDLTSSSNPAFEVPSGYIDGSSSWAGPSAAYCAPTATGMILPDIVISHHAHSGQSVLTNIAFGSCVFVNVTIYAGPGIAAKALTPEGQPVFQVLISDTDTYSGPSLNVARIFLTASDGMQTSTTFRNVIVIRF